MGQLQKQEPKKLVLVEGAGHIPPVEARVPAINAWLDEVDWNECPEAGYMYWFLGLMDFAGCYPER